uniref:Uncharacterized protein n=1 Tax=Romanomermis culicivorax TaxID=13658 RepID=A0A915J1N1_ROMCU
MVEEVAKKFINTIEDNDQAADLDAGDQVQKENRCATKNGKRKTKVNKKMALYNSTLTHAPFNAQSSSSSLHAVFCKGCIQVLHKDLNEFVVNHFDHFKAIRDCLSPLP